METLEVALRGTAEAGLTSERIEQLELTPDDDPAG